MEIVQSSFWPKTSFQGQGLGTKAKATALCPRGQVQVLEDTSLKCFDVYPGLEVEINKCRFGNCLSVVADVILFCNCLRKEVAACLTGSQESVGVPQPPTP